MKRIIFKLGTGILSCNGGRALDIPQFRRIAEETARLKKEKGIDCAIVSSGAVAAGIPVLGLEERPSDLVGKQACAAVGQPALMSRYEESFQPHGIHVGQLLLSHSDIDSRMRRNNARHTMERLLQNPRVIPIVNENDSVAVEELHFGDNDRLSAEVAALVGADALVILTSVDGLLDDGKLIPSVNSIDDAFRFVTEETGRFSVGGMRTKLEAARIAADAGIPTIIANGREPGAIVRIAQGEAVGTRIFE